ncbi:O-antigen ligase family protein [Candidatus Woesebacteria bacterium]|nr:O-antigen ligase family protein [Candidatus Woesebacteria bacterium]
MKKLDNILKYGAAFLLLAIPLYPKFPFITIPGTYVSVRLEDFLIGVVSLLAIVVVFPNIKQFFKKDIEFSIFVFLLVTGVSVVSAILITKTVLPHIALLHWSRRIEYFLPFLIGTVVMKKNQNTTIDFFVRCLMIVVFVVFLYGVGQKYLSWPVIITQNEEYSKGIALRYIPGAHINSTFAGHYDLATYLILVLPIIVTLLFILKSKWERPLLLIVWLSGLWLLANAISRISIISYLGATCLALIISKKIKAIPVVLVISLVIFGLSGDLVARYNRIIEVSLKNLQKINKVIYITKEVYAQESEPHRTQSQTPVPVSKAIFEDRSTSIRLNVEWPRAMRAFTKNPILGTGFSSITLATDNDFLRLLGEVGLMGFFAFTLILARLVAFSIKKLKIITSLSGAELGFAAGVIGGFTGILVNAMFIDIFEASKVAIMLWLIIGIFIQMVRNKENEQTI